MWKDIKQVLRLRISTTSIWVVVSIALHETGAKDYCHGRIENDMSMLVIGFSQIRTAVRTVSAYESWIPIRMEDLDGCVNSQGNECNAFVMLSYRKMLLHQFSISEVKKLKSWAQYLCVLDVPRIVHHNRFHIHTPSVHVLVFSIIDW